MLQIHPPTWLARFAGACLLLGCLSTTAAVAQTTPPKKPKNDRKEALNSRKNKIKTAKIKSESVIQFDAPDGVVSETGVKQLERTYDPEGNLLEETKFKRDGSVERKLKNEYNAKGDVEKTDASQGNGPGADNKNPGQISYAYDEQDNMIESTTRNQDGTLLVKTKNRYDGNGKLTEMLTENENSDPKRKLFITAIAELAVPTIQSARVREQLDRQGIVADAAGADVLGAIWQRENAEWGAVIREARITGE